jgi:23S rRNA pseudouridine1911/1915/1917 synthase
VARALAPPTTVLLGVTLPEAAALAPAPADVDVAVDADSDDLVREVRLLADRKPTLARLDKFLCDRVAKASRNQLQNAIRAGAITVNGRPTKTAYRVHPGDVVLWVQPAEAHGVTRIIPEEMALDIRYEDATVLLNGLAHHLAHLPVGPSGEVRPGLVHRIDRDTTGLLIVGKTDWAVSHLSKQFFHHTIERTYYALVWGVPAATGTIRGDIGTHPRHHKLRIVCSDGEAGKPAVTHYEVVRAFGHAALVKCRLETGRTHQIRVHFQSIGHPVFGDTAYGGDVLQQGPRTAQYRQFVADTLALIPRQALHAASLGFEHPDTGARLYFEAELPADFAAALAQWERFANERATNSAEVDN